MTTHHGSVNFSMGDGSARLGLPGRGVTLRSLALELRKAGQGATAVALGPQGPVLQATLAGLRAHGVAVGWPVPQAFTGQLPALLVLPSSGAGTGAPAASGIGFIEVSAGVSTTHVGLLLPAVQKVREAAAHRMPIKHHMRLVMVQAAADSVLQEQLSLNFTKVDWDDLD